MYAKKLYESAFHPDSGDLQNVFGRMSFQVPGGMAITGAMLQFYKYLLLIIVSCVISFDTCNPFKDGSGCSFLAIR